MCGRFRVDARLELYQRLGLDTGPLVSSFNLAPTQNAPVVRPDGNRRVAELMRFGFLPFYAKTLGEGAKTINARIETVLEKPAFSKAVQTHRCVIPAEGFYEWADDTRQPYYFSAADGGPLWFGGIWSRRTIAGQDVASFAILTTAPHPAVAPYHNRTPLMLADELVDRWLDPLPFGVADLASTAAHCHSVGLSAWPVSKAVGNVRNNDPSLIDPLPAVPAEARQD